MWPTTARLPVPRSMRRSKCISNKDDNILCDCRKSSYRIAQDFRLLLRSNTWSPVRLMAGLCDRRRDEEGERKDQQGGMSLDRNRLSALLGLEQELHRFKPGAQLGSSIPGIVPAVSAPMCS